MKLKAIMCAAVTAAAFPAYGLTACPTSERLVQPARTFEDAVASLPNHSPKGEFESTAAYEARKSTTPSAGEMLIEISMLTGSKYNADKQAFEYFEYGFNATTLLDSLNGISPEAKAQFNFDYRRPVSLAVTYRRDTTGTYEGQNAFGAATTVTKVEVTEHVVFDNLGRKSLTGDSLFAEYKDYKERYLSIPVSIDRAPAVKDKMRAVALIVPRAPYSTSGSYVFRPTRNIPTDATGSVSIIFADIRCVGILDEEGHLLASWATR